MKLRQIRLLPVVIAATCALLLLKGVGIMTSGGYVLTGTDAAVAAGGGGGHEAPAADAGAEAMLTLPVEPTMTDSSPVLDDHAPVLPLRAEAGGHGESGGHGEATDAHGAPAGEGHGTETTDVADAEAAHDAEAAPVDERRAAVAGSGKVACSPEVLAQAKLEGFDQVEDRKDCVIDPGVNEHGDALPSVKDGEGNTVPLAIAEGGTSSEVAILERLATRRQELDIRESELDMRLTLVEAAEKRIEERTAVLEALEARINAMVDEKRALEETQFVAVVSMYETMKAKDAAAIFDQLEMQVLLRVARAMNPRKMAPIMAKMNPQRAMELTSGMAVDQVEPKIDLASEDFGTLPQIVGE